MNFEPLIPPFNERSEAESRIRQLGLDLRDNGGDDVITMGLIAATIRFTPSPALSAAIARASILDPVCPAPNEAGWAVALYDVVGAGLGTFTCDVDCGYVFSSGVEVAS